MPKSLETPHRRLINLETQGVAGVPLVGSYAYRRAGAPLLTHSHDAYEFCFMHRGRQRYRFANGEECELRAGDLMMVRPGVLHGTGGEGERPGALFWMQIRLTPKGGCFIGWPAREVMKFDRRLRRLGDWKTVSIENSARLLGYFSALFESCERRSGDHMKRMKIASLAGLIIAEMTDLLVEETTLEKPDPTWSRLVSNDDGVPLTVAEMAKRSGMAVPTFKRRFKQVMGAGPATFERTQRLEQAIRELQQTQTPITRLSMNLGFHSSQHFATTFKKHIGVSPSAYRAFHQP